MISINKIPYLYDPLWIEHNIHYWEFHKYKFIKDVSLKNQKIFLPLLLFLKEGQYYLFSAGDYINTPYFYNSSNQNIHKVKSLKPFVKYLNSLKNEYSIKNIKIQQYPYDSYKLRYSFLDMLGKRTYYRYRSWINLKENTLAQIKSNFRKSYKQFVNREYPTNIYFGNQIYQVEKNIQLVSTDSHLPNDIEGAFKTFQNKHLELAGRITKSQTCWDILKEMVVKEKSILAEYDNNFVYCFVSEDYSYYGINAAGKKNGICHCLIYQVIKWLKHHKYNYLDLGSTYFTPEIPESDKYHWGEKNDMKKTYEIGFFKSGFGNQYAMDFYGYI